MNPIIFEYPLTIVDVETTGAHGANDRIIEVGILRVENGVITKQFESLVNPEIYVNPFITSMTGITPEQLEIAPTFGEIKEDVYSLFEDSYFVAHNVRFDYGFFKNEYKRLGVDFSTKYFCSARLSRLLFPHHRRHNLDAIIERFQIECVSRHRAMGDAKVIYDFFTKLEQTIEPPLLQAALGRMLIKTSAPPELAPVVDSLPEGPGVYLFYDKNDTLLYVGKSTNIRSRVMSHFSGDYMAESEATLTAQTTRIEFRQTHGELGALLMESNLVKSLMPIHNRQLRQHLEYAVIRKYLQNGYLNARIETVSKIRPDETNDILGIFSAKLQAKNTMETVAKDFHLCNKLLGTEKTKGACFNHKLGTCAGACTGGEPPAEYNERLLAGFMKTSLRPWKYSSPVIITEKSDSGGELFIVDSWCIIGNGKFDEGGGREFQEKKPIFDYDVYKILKNYLRNPNNKQKIRKISKNDFKQLKDSCY